MRRSVLVADEAETGVGDSELNELEMDRAGGSGGGEDLPSAAVSQRRWEAARSYDDGWWWSAS